MTAESSTGVMRRYLQDAIAAESSYETQFRAFATGSTDEEVNTLFATQAEDTASHCLSLTARLQELGGHPSTAKSFLAHLFSLTPRTAQVGHVQEEKTTQNLIMAFTIENSAYAMYEALAAAANAAGDEGTEALALGIQTEEKQAAVRKGRGQRPEVTGRQRVVLFFGVFGKGI